MKKLVLLALLLAAGAAAFLYFDIDDKLFGEKFTCDVCHEEYEGEKNEKTVGDHTYVYCDECKSFMGEG